MAETVAPEFARLSRANAREAPAAGDAQDGRGRCLEPVFIEAGRSIELMRVFAARRRFLPPHPAQRGGGVEGENELAVASPASTSSSATADPRAHPGALRPERQPASRCCSPLVAHRAGRSLRRHRAAPERVEIVIAAWGDARRWPSPGSACSIVTGIAAATGKGTRAATCWCRWTGGERAAASRSCRWRGIASPAPPR